MFDIALGIFLFLSPILFLPIQIGNINTLQFYQFGTLSNSGYNYLQLLFFEFGAITLCIISLLSKPQREFNDKWIVVLLSLFCLNVYFHPIGIKMIVPILLGFLLYYLVVVYAKNYQKLFKFIFLTSLLNTIFAVLQFFHINLIYNYTSGIYGLMCISTHLGSYQVIALPICFALNPFLAIIPIVGIILSKSVSAIFIMLCWILIKSFIGFKIKGRKFSITSVPIFLSIFITILFFIFYNWNPILGKINIRLTVWIPTIKEIIQHPFIGYGIKPFSYNSPIGWYACPHNIYIGIIWFLGILVLIPIFMIIKNIFKINNVVSSSLIIALIMGMEKSIMDFPRLSGTVIILFGLLILTKEAQVEN